VHDGDADTADYVSEKMNEKEMSRYTEEEKEKYKFTSRRFSVNLQNVYIRDRNNSKLQIKVDSYQNDSHYRIDESLRVAIFKWFSEVTGAKIFGFFITETNRDMNKSIANKYYDSKGRTVKDICNQDFNYVVPYYHRSDFVISLCKKLKQDKFLQSHNIGYDAFFIMPGGSGLNIEDEELSITGNFTANKLKTAFMKMNKKRQVNRIMVSRFIDGIAV
jgi:ribosomal protein L28